MKLSILLLCLLCATAPAHAQDWVTRFENKILAFEALPKPADNSMIVTGNSNIVMWPDLEKDLAPLPAVKRGFGGSTTEELNYYLDRIVFSSKPGSVVICEGENDFGMGYDEQEIAALHGKIIARIHEFDPKIRIYVIGLKPSPRRFSKWDRFQATNVLLEQVCKEASRCTYIPPPAGLLGPDGMPKASLYRDDELHLNRQGYAVWTAAVRPLLIEGESRAARTPMPPTSVRALTPADKG